MKLKQCKGCDFLVKNGMYEECHFDPPTVEGRDSYGRYPAVVPSSLGCRRHSDLVAKVPCSSGFVQGVISDPATGIKSKPFMVNCSDCRNDDPTRRCCKEGIDTVIRQVGPCAYFKPVYNDKWRNAGDSCLCDECLYDIPPPSQYCREHLDNGDRMALMCTHFKAKQNLAAKVHCALCKKELLAIQATFRTGTGQTLCSWCAERTKAPE